MDFCMLVFILNILISCGNLFLINGFQDILISSSKKTWKEKTVLSYHLMVENTFLIATEIAVVVVSLLIVIELVVVVEVVLVVVVVL